MTEPEVSLYIALYYIRQGLTKSNVKVSIDGAHVKTKNQIHFDIQSFMKENHCKKIDGDTERWQGIYEVLGHDAKIEISSVPGIGDVNIQLLSGELLWIESKKGKANKSGQEYVLMREAIGQLMTNEFIPSYAIPVVAVPYSEKSFSLASKWSALERVKKEDIRFLLVENNGNVITVN